MEPNDNVPLRFDSSNARRTVSAQNSEVIVRAILKALHIPLSAAIKEVVISTARTGEETYTELVVLHQSAKVARRVRLSFATAQEINVQLERLENDGFDPEVKAQLREHLIKILISELEHQERRGR